MEKLSNTICKNCPLRSKGNKKCAALDKLSSERPWVPRKGACRVKVVGLLRDLPYEEDRAILRNGGSVRIGQMSRVVLWGEDLVAEVS